MSSELGLATFFHKLTFSYSYLAWDTATRQAVIIDPVLDFDQASGRISLEQVDLIYQEIEKNDLSVAWILDTHVHADHLSAAAYLQERCGGLRAIGAGVQDVQRNFKTVFNLDDTFACTGNQFDRLLHDGEALPLGELNVQVMATPGHTPSCSTYVVGHHAFVGDTLFMPDYGSARTDFPGGCARQLYNSIQRILSLPAETVLHMCHDYGTAERSEFQSETTVAEQMRYNVHIAGQDEEAFVTQRQARDADLAAPKLLYPAVQFNIRAGRAPRPEDNQRSYFKIPLRLP